MAWAARGLKSDVGMLYLCKVNGVEVDMLAQVASVPESAFPNLRVVLVSSSESKEGYTGSKCTKHVRGKLTGRVSSAIMAKPLTASRRLLDTICS